jgi:hypothetical protein
MRNALEEEASGLVWGERSWQVRTIFSSDLWIVPKRAFSTDDLSRIGVLLRTGVRTRSETTPS